MRRARWLVAGALTSCLLFRGAPGLGGLVGSVHDFSANGWSGGEICVVCHTPHHAAPSVQGAPLWHHAVTAANHNLYSSPTLQGTPEQPRGSSKLCLSCHDGTVAIDSFGGTAGGQFMMGDARLGIDLADDHPINIKWEHQTDQPSCSNCHIVHPWGWNNEVPMFDGYVECATCHDVHNGTGYPKLLRKPMTNSELCLHCHGK